MSAKAIDVLIFIPLIPAIPVIATWWLPWESWLPRKVPKKVLGPYLLYVSFAAWHFNLSRWSVVLFVLMGIVVSTMAVFDVRKARQVKKSRDWPTAEARVIASHQTPDADGFPNVTLGYTYKVDNKRYGGSGSFAFRNAEDAARFEDAHREGQSFHHYRPDKPEISVVAPEDRVIGDKSPFRK